MKKKTRIAAVALALAVGTGTVALAAGNLVSISVFPGMNLAINGETFVPKDVNGKEVDVFSYNGTTYVPIRAISQAFGMDVSYHWADNIISGVFTKGTDGWVKISIPAYAGVGTGNPEQPLNSAW